ncbi:MAG: hypothetical protein ACTSQF_06860 [Candidatus Heimdallarchaeaceae archaeon]
MTSIIESLKHEMTAAFKMLDNAISRIEGNFWKIEENNWMYGYVIFHSLEGLEFHMSDSPKDWVPLTKVSVNSQEQETANLKTKTREFFEDYSTKVKKKAFDNLEKFSDKDMLENDGFVVNGFV